MWWHRSQWHSLMMRNGDVWRWNRAFLAVWNRSGNAGCRRNLSGDWRNRLHSGDMRGRRWKCRYFSRLQLRQGDDSWWSFQSDLLSRNNINRRRSFSGIVVRCNRCRGFLHHDCAFRHFLQMLRLRSRRVVRLVVIRVCRRLDWRFNIHRLEVRLNISLKCRWSKIKLIKQNLHNKPAIKCEKVKLCNK